MVHPLPEQALNIGDLVADRFRLQRPLGAGGMADVWEATDERLHRAVAVKVLRVDPAASPQQAALARQRFQDEGRLAARHTHPSIVSVFDAGDVHGHAYLVMERLSGETLRDRLASGSLSDHEARSMMTRVLAALDASHRAGVVHRDIKPSNVLRGADGGWKVADFGIAKALDDDASTADLTITGQVIGTPRYMAPERLAGQPATPASDIYGAGMLLSEALGDREDVDPTLRAAARRATALDPAARFASAQSMSDAIHGSIGAETEALVVTTPTSPLDDARGAAPPLDPTVVAPDPPTRPLVAAQPEHGRHRARAALALVAVLLVCGALAAAALSGGDPTGPPPSTTTTEVSTDDTTTAVSTEPVVTTTAVPSTTAPPPTTAPEPKASPPEEKGKGKGKPKDEPG